MIYEVANHHCKSVEKILSLYCFVSFSDSASSWLVSGKIAQNVDKTYLNAFV